MLIIVVVVFALALAMSLLVHFYIRSLRVGDQIDKLRQMRSADEDDQTAETVDASQRIKRNNARFGSSSAAASYDDNDRIVLNAVSKSHDDDDDDNGESASAFEARH